ncbi:MAG TPA: hypothetical protein VK047_16760 [Zeimonas sp.]|nr:hypothetical protein [Zeimonas sp.]
MTNRISIRGALACTVLTLGMSGAAQAEIVFSDAYGTRPHGQDIWDTLPTTASAGVGTYGRVLDWPYSGKIDAFTPLGTVLKFDTSSGAATQMVYVPYSHTFGAGRVEITLRAAHGTNQPGFNNFAIGFGDPVAGIFTDHILVQSDRIELNLPGTGTTTSVAFGSTPGTFYEFVLGYDPALAGRMGEQPWSLSINGAMIDIPVEATTVYTALDGFAAVAFGGRHSNGLTTRFISDFALSILPGTSVPTPGSAALVGAGLVAGFALRRRRRAG